MQPIQHVQPHAATRPVTPHQQAVYSQLRHATAMAGGLEALATQSLDAGEATPDQLDYIAGLATHLTQYLSDLASAYAELPDNS